MPTEAMLVNPKFKVRNFDDGAISYQGSFDLSNVKTSKEYFVLTKIENELAYKNVSEDVYLNYANTKEGMEVANFLANKENIRTIKGDYLSDLAYQRRLKAVDSTLDPLRQLDISALDLTYPAQIVISKLKNSMYDHVFDSKFIKELDNLNDLLVNEGISAISFDEMSAFLKYLDPNDVKDLMNHHVLDYLIDSAKGNDEVAGVSIDTALKFSDPKQFLYAKIPEIFANNTLSIEEYLELYHSKPSNIKRSDGLYKLEKYLSKQDRQILNDMKESASNPNHLFSKYDQDMIAGYTYGFGPYLCSYLRGAVTSYMGQKIEGTDITAVKDETSRVFRRLGIKKLENLEVSKIVESLDSIIDKAPALEEDTIVYRGCNGLFFNGTRLDTSIIGIGTKFNDPGFLSTSAIPSRISDIGIINLEIELPKGSKAAYIEPFTGAGIYVQQEVLLGRNNTFEVTDIQINENTKQLILKVKMLEK